MHVPDEVAFSQLLKQNPLPMKHLS
jgi:hypothetical protein